MKTKRERFEIIASNRVQKIIDTLDSLSKCSNRNNYEYNEIDIRKMEKVFKEKMNEVLALFNNGLKKGYKTEFKF
ncbi:MAG: hypothetical protein FVQ77_04365 [Cytophagales bacterium]|nr:hypothetical protein [Cytophagales bacterium]